MSKTLEFMTQHFRNLKSMAPALFLSSLNDLSIMANGGSLEDERDRLYPEELAASLKVTSDVFVA